MRARVRACAQEAMKDLVETFIDIIMKKNGTARELVQLLVDGLEQRDIDRMPKDFGEEIVGIAHATGIDLGWVWVLNIVCAD